MKERADTGNQSYYLRYTLAFLCLASIIFVSTYVVMGRDIIWEVDGIAQPFTFFVYEGMWLRDIVVGLFSGQGLSIPVWDMSFGYGSDIVPTLGCYFIDPFNLVSVICPVEYAEYFFSFLVVGRLYLAGLAFSCYALHRNKGHRETLAGALVYCFCSTALVAVFWPQGAEPLILFPIVLLGADRLFSQKKAGLFIFSVTAFFLLDISFSYVCCLALVPYCAWRVFTTAKTTGQKVTPGNFLVWVARVVACLVVAFLISCILVLPTLIPLLGTGRLSYEASVPLLYDPSYYCSLLSGFISSKNVGSDCYIGYGGAALITCCALFIDRSHAKENRSLIIAFIVTTLFLLIPFIGHVLNGFNYVTNRWVWIYALVISYIVTSMMVRIAHFTRKQNLALLCCVLVYGLVVALFFRSIVMLSCAIYPFVVLTVCFFMLSKPTPRMRENALIGCICASLLICSCVRFSYAFNGWSSGGMAAGTAASRILTNTSTEAAAGIDDDSLWRYDSDNLSPQSGKWTLADRYRNTSLAQDVNGIDYYWSFYNEDIDRFHTELAVNGTYINFSYTSLDSRAALLALSGVKYFVSTDMSGNALPYNYNDVSRARNEVTVAATDEDYTAATGFVPLAERFVAYEGVLTLPLAFTYSSAIPRSTYASLTPLKRQQAMMQGVVLEDADIADFAEPAKPVFTDEQVAWHVESANGASVVEDDGGASSIVVSVPNATLALSFDGLPDSETYLCFDNLNIADSNAASYTIDIETACVHDRSLENFTPESHMYGGKSDWCVNLGYSEQPQRNATLTFSTPGTYTFDELSIIAQPMSEYNTQVKALGKDVLENIEEGNNRITGNITLDESKYLYLSVPYSTGWKAYVDGVETTVSKANTAFMAVYLTPGYHEVEFVYSTPGLAVGAILSGIGIASFVGILVIQRQRTRRKEGTHQ